jgi:omega-6 fatty acid desaturase (delta-12 desaturase)
MKPNSQVAHIEEIRATIKSYSHSNNLLASWHLLSSLLALIACIYFSIQNFSQHKSYLFFMVPLTSFFYLKLFMIFHDSAHLSYFSSKKMNLTAAKLLSFILVTPVSRWSKNHNFHHSNFGNLDKKDTGQTILSTLKNYEEMKPLKKILFRIFREPLVFFSCFPFIHWFIIYTLEGRSVLTIAGWAFIFFFSLKYSFLVMFLPAMLALTYGTLLFHFQHAVNPGVRNREKEWSFETSALGGSSYQRMPFPLSLFTFGIEFHHIHHLSPKVPSYYLRKCHHALPASTWQEAGVTEVSFAECLYSIKNTLYDEENKKYVRFKYFGK